MRLKTIELGEENEFDVVLADYSDRECAYILMERNSYMLRVQHSWGKDYGGCQCDENDETYYEEILPERVLVKDGHFCGVSICAVYDYCNGGSRVYYEDGILLVDDPDHLGSRSVKDGGSFSNDDHSRWNYWEYSLVTRREAEDDTENYR